MCVSELCPTASGGGISSEKVMVFSEARAVAAGCARMCGSYAPAQQTAAALLVFSDTTRPLGTNSCPHAFLRASYSYRRPRAECILPPVKLDLSVEVTDRGERGGACSSSSGCWYVQGTHHLSSAAAPANGGCHVTHQQQPTNFLSRIYALRI